MSDGLVKQRLISRAGRLCELERPGGVLTWRHAAPRYSRSAAPAPRALASLGTPLLSARLDNGKGVPDGEGTLMRLPIVVAWALDVEAPSWRWWLLSCWWAAAAPASLRGTKPGICGV
ncbi:MAG: hypothetical protein ACRDO2_01140 [Nocardioidaceae bacterium]